MNKTIAELMAAKKVLEGRLRSAIAEFEAEYGFQCDAYIQVLRSGHNNQGVLGQPEEAGSLRPIERVRVSLRVDDIID
jgi:hypothetical protein